MTKLRLVFAALAIFAASQPAGAYTHRFETVEGDPTNTLLYTLPNGLKLYMSVNKDEPRIQTYIAVRVGGKNDPAETTGLAHYFEHLMFKGTEKFGTSDYQAEKPYLDAIEQLFETYRTTTDSLQRAEIYHQIDSLSYQASLIAIPNEYDKLMASIGANGTNAYTSTDVTCYVENIPSNQIENWAKIQADRFQNPILRGFHTELETIYEEKNMSLTNDARKSYEAILAALYPLHPYGTQTVLGTQEHLKNPSITNVKNYHKTWYVPNNMAICVAGDFDPDQMANIVEKWFGAMQPNPQLPALDFPEQPQITAPIEKKVKGIDAEQIYLAWRTPAAADKDAQTVQIMAEVLQNGKCGLIDLNITTPQRLLSSGAFVYDMADGGALIVTARPKAGQSLDDARSILLAEIENLRNGNFDESLIPAIVNNAKLQLQSVIESNQGRASTFVDAFVNGQEWKDVVADIRALDNITKDDVVKAANKYLAPEEYVAIYKVQEKDDSQLKIAKPKLTPIATNRDKQSDFLAEIQNSSVEPIQPRFLDFERDLTFAKTNNGLQILYTQNKTNDIASLTFVYDYGYAAERPLASASAYLMYLGTPEKTVEQIKTEFYNLACSYRVSVSKDRVYVTIEGLSENLPKALALYENLVENAVDNPEVWQNLAMRNVKAMNDAKANQSQNFTRLANYATYGSLENSPQSLQYTPEQLQQLDSKEIIAALRNLNDYTHRIIYYGPESLDAITDVLNKTHHVADNLLPAPENKEFAQQLTGQNTVFVAPYDAKQIYMRLINNRGEKFDAETEPVRQLYNEYFGGGMNSIVFQEMRESRSLAYSAWATMSRPSKKDENYTFFAQIATQNDKMGDAVDAFYEIINNMPVSEAAFDLAKQGLDSRLRTERIIKDDIAWAWLNAQRLGINYDTRKQMFDALPALTLDNVKDYQQKHVLNNNYNIAILGKVEDLDMNKLNELGTVKILTTEDIFGY